MEKTINFPLELLNLISEIYKESKRLNPQLTENEFMLNLIKSGLAPFKKSKPVAYNKEQVKLRNDIKLAVKYANKTQSELANDIGLNRTYLQKIIAGKYEPSVTLALQIVMATGYPKLEDIFFLEPLED